LRGYAPEPSLSSIDRYNTDRHMLFQRLHRELNAVVVKSGADERDPRVLDLIRRIRATGEVRIGLEQFPLETEMRRCSGMLRYASQGRGRYSVEEITEIEATKARVQGVLSALQRPVNTLSGSARAAAASASHVGRPLAASSSSSSSAAASRAPSSLSSSSSAQAAIAHGAALSRMDSDDSDIVEVLEGDEARDFLAEQELRRRAWAVRNRDVRAAVAEQARRRGMAGSKRNRDEEQEEKEDEAALGGAVAPVRAPVAAGRSISTETTDSQRDALDLFARANGLPDGSLSKRARRHGRRA